MLDLHKPESYGKLRGREILFTCSRLCSSSLSYAAILFIRLPLAGASQLLLAVSPTCLLEWAPAEPE